MNSMVKKIIPFISSIIISLIFTITINADLNFVVDDANLLSSQEETKLRIDLENFKNEYAIQYWKFTKHKIVQDE